MKIADILNHKSRVVHSVLPWLTVGEVVEQLARFGIGAVLVCDEKGGLRGIVSERDIVRALGRHGTALLPMPLTEISFSNRCFSSIVKNPNSAIASSRTCVWMCKRTSLLLSGSAEYVEIGIATS